MSDLPRDLVAVVLKNGDAICTSCVEKTPEVLDDEANTVVLSSDDWKSDVVGNGQLCDRCEHELEEEP